MQAFYLLSIVLILASCSTNRQKKCTLCDNFIAENDEIFYPERIVTDFGMESFTSDNSDEHTYTLRVLTNWEFGKLQKELFCFIGESEEKTETYFKHLLPDEYGIRYSKDSTRITKELIVRVYKKGNSVKNTYEYGRFYS